MERGITWNIDTLQYSDKELGKLSEFVYHYDTGISKSLDEVLEQRRADEMARKEREAKLKSVTESILREHYETRGPRGRKPKWTEETIREEARKYNLRSEFSRGSAGAYSAAKGLGLIDELFPKEIKSTQNSE